MYKDERKVRMQELIQKNKDKRKQEIDPMLIECIKLLHPIVEVLSEIESEIMYNDLQEQFPFVWWGRIDWENLEDKIQIINLFDIINYLNARHPTEDYIVFVLWGYSLGNSPVIKTNLQNAFNHIEDINAVGEDQWLYCPSCGFVIEFYHNGEIKIGFRS